MEQIALRAVSLKTAVEAGAAILRVHARDAATSRPTGDLDIWFHLLRSLKQRTPAVLTMTTGGSTFMSIEDRLNAPDAAKPELCSCNRGSMNFGTHDDPEIPGQLVA